MLTIGRRHDAQPVALEQLDEDLPLIVVVFDVEDDLRRVGHRVPVVHAGVRDFEGLRARGDPAKVRGRSR